jgi:hypothetical protein
VLLAVGSFVTASSKPRLHTTRSSVLMCTMSVPATIVRAVYRDLYFLSGIVSGVSPESTTKTANKLAGFLSLAFSLILWCAPGAS